MAVLMRGLERFEIIFVAGLSIYWGAKLFLEGVVKTQQADLVGGGWTLRLQKVGPGVFLKYKRGQIYLSGKIILLPFFCYIIPNSSARNCMAFNSRVDKGNCLIIF